MNKLILLVEDNASDEKLTVLALNKTGIPHDIVVRRDGAAALSYLHQDEVQPLPALVLLDLKLPFVDGLEVLERIRANGRTRSTPVVVLTASREHEDIMRSYALGANAYVRKPVEFNELITAAKTLGAFWLTLNEPPTGAPK